MPRDPQTGEFVSQEVYDAIIAEEGPGPQPADQPRPYQAPTTSAEAPRANPITMLMFVVVLLLGGYIVFKEIRPAGDAGPIVTPSSQADAAVASIGAKLAGDPAKAAEVAKAYSGLRDALAGVSGNRVTDSKVYAAVSIALLTDLDANTGTPIGRDIDQAVASYVGIQWGTDGPGDPAGWEFKTFTAADRARLVEIVGAIARTAKAQTQ